MGINYFSWRDRARLGIGYTLLKKFSGKRRSGGEAARGRLWDNWPLSVRGGKLFNCPTFKFLKFRGGAAGAAKKKSGFWPLARKKIRIIFFFRRCENFLPKKSINGLILRKNAKLRSFFGVIFWAIFLGLRSPKIPMSHFFLRGGFRMSGQLSHFFYEPSREKSKKHVFGPKKMQ